VSAASEGWRGDTFRVFQKEGVPPLVLWATEWGREEDAVRFQSFALKIALKLVPPDPALMAPVLRHRTSVVFLLNVPKELQDSCLDHVWTSKRIQGKKTDVFGE
ncbi:MAG TPA: hypothetical protein VEN81_07235, partial [Planctomycetota bacterium]|nr:hypothetical protein [Planctomycetota bacterium]